jgi:hypothetical protein
MDESKTYEEMQRAAAQALNSETALSAAPAYSIQRRYPRIRCFLAVQLRFVGNQGMLVGKLSDVSLGGCGIESPHPVAIDTQVTLCPLDANGEFWVDGAVVNMRLVEGAARYHMGVRFFDENAALAPAIEKFVRFVEQASAKQKPSGSYLETLARRTDWE